MVEAVVERFYNPILQGIQGFKKIKVNALNEEIEQVSYQAPQSQNIKLAVDLELQQFVADVFGKDAGSVIVMSLKDGAIIAAGSFPEYDLNPFVLGISQAEWEELVKKRRSPIYK